MHPMYMYCMYVSMLCPYIGKYVHPDGGEMNVKVEKLNVHLGVYVHGHNVHTYMGMTDIMWLVLLFY